MTRCYFLCMFVVGIMNIIVAKLVAFEAEALKKLILTFSSSIFPNKATIINLGNNIWRIEFIQKILNFNYRLEI